MPPATATSIASASISTVTISTASTSDNASVPNVNVGAIVGGLIAGIFAALLLAAAGYYLIRRRRSRRGTPQSHVRPRVTRGRAREASSEGLHPLLHPTVSQFGHQTEYNPYSDHHDTILPSPSRSARPHSHTPTQMNYREIDLPTSTSSTMMEEIPTPESPPRPSLPPLVIPSGTVPDGDSRDTVTVTSSGLSSGDESMSAYSQASASTRLRSTTVWEEPPEVPSIPSQYRSMQGEVHGGPEENYNIDTNDMEGNLLRGNTEKVSRLLKSRARRARRGGASTLLSRSTTMVSHIERSDSLRTGSSPSSPHASLTIRNPFDDSAISSRSASVTTSSTSIANHTPHWHGGAQRLSVIDNEDAETESLYADEISTVPGPF